MTWPAPPVEPAPPVPVDLGGPSGDPAWPPIPLTNVNEEEGTPSAWGQAYSLLPAPDAPPSPPLQGPAQFPQFDFSPGLEALAQALPDAILLDLMMPVMDGFEFAEHLRRNDRWRSIPVVVVTAKELSLQDRARLSGLVKGILERGGGEMTDVVDTVLETLQGQLT